MPRTLVAPNSYDRVARLEKARKLSDVLSDAGVTAEPLGTPASTVSIVRQSHRAPGPRLKGSMFTHEQRAAILSQAASGCAAAVCRQHGILPQTLYHWKKASAGAAN